MSKVILRAAALAVVLSCGAQAGFAMAAAKQPAKSYVIVNEDVGVPVFPYDITDRPYKVLGEIKAGALVGL